MCVSPGHSCREGTVCWPCVLNCPLVKTANTTHGWKWNDLLVHVFISVCDSLSPVRLVTQTVTLKKAYLRPRPHTRWIEILDRELDRENLAVHQLLRAVACYSVSRVHVASLRPEWQTYAVWETRTDIKSTVWDHYGFLFGNSEIGRRLASN